MQSSSAASNQINYTRQLIEALKQPINSADILSIFAQARIAHEKGGMEAQKPSNQLARSTTQISVPEDSLQDVSLGEEHEQQVKQFEQEQEAKRSLEQQQQLADLAASQLRLEASFNQEQSVLQKIFELENPEIIKAALEHIRFAYSKKSYAEIPEEITEALEQRQQAYFDYQELAGYFSKAIEYLVKNFSTKQEYCPRYISQLLHAMTHHGDLGLKQSEVDDLSCQSGYTVFSVMSNESGQTCYSAGGTEEGVTGCFNASPGKQGSLVYRSSSARNSSIATGVGRLSSGLNGRADFGGSFRSSLDAVSDAGSEQNQELTLQENAKKTIEQMLSKEINPDIRQSTCFSRNGGFVDRLNKIKSKIKPQGVGSVQGDHNLEAKDLDTVLNNAQKAGEQKQVALLAEKALVKLLKHLNSRWLGLWDKGGKKAAVEGLLEQLRTGSIDQEEFTRQLSKSSSSLSSDSPVSDSDKSGEQTTVYEKLKSPTGWFQWNGYKAQSALEAEKAVKMFKQALTAVQAG